MDVLQVYVCICRFHALASESARLAAYVFWLSCVMIAENDSVIRVFLYV